MKKQLIACIAIVFCIGITENTTAQAKKEKKSKYYQNSEQSQDFDVQGFVIDREKKEVDGKTKETEYDVKVTRNEEDGKYKGEKRVIEEESEISEEEIEVRKEKRKKEKEGYYTTYGAYKPYDEKREKYDKYYGPGTPPAQKEVAVQEEVVEVEEPKTTVTKKVKVKKQKELEIKMTDQEHEYRTTVVKRRYTNLDVFCDDLDLAKIQRPVFKGICQECADDVDRIITNRNLSSLEKNYELKQCYMMRDKRLRETLDEDQYKKFLRIKDADEYLILTKDSELKDGVNN